MEEEVKNPEAVLAELRRAQADLKELRQSMTALEAERDGLKQQVESLGQDEMRLKALAAETKLALNELGITDQRALTLLGTDGLDFDENGKVTGINERVSELKKDWPEVFDPKVRAGGKADIFSNDSADVKENPLKVAVHHALNG